MNSSSIKHEQKTFADLVRKGRNIIFISLIFNQSNFDEFVEERKLERWVWVANDYRYILSYPEDVNVFSFGLLKAKQGSLEVKINNGNLTEACKHHFNSYLAQHISKVVQRNSSVTENAINTSEGYICHSKLEIDLFDKRVSEFSAVQLGYPFWCYTDNNTAVVVEKSYVNYIVIFIIFFIYCFYPLAIESAFYIEDRKMVQGSYYMSESPYSPSVACKRILFAGNNKYVATLRIIIFVTVLTSVIYKIKSYVYDDCNCLLKSSNDNQSFQHAENIYSNCKVCIALGIFHFLVVNICVLLNSNGTLDDFIFFDFTNFINCGMFLKTVEVSIFLSEDEKQRKQDEEQSDQTKHMVSFKIQKLSLILSYSFWSKIFFINSVGQYEDKHCKCYKCFYEICKKYIIFLQPILCFPINIGLVLCSTFCPLVSNVYVFFVKRFFIIKCIRKCTCEVNEQNEINGIEDRSADLGNNDNEEDNGREEIEENSFSKKNDCTRKNKYCICSQFIYHISVIAILTLIYMYSFNIFFYGLSYVIQFFIFTLFLAVPHFPIQFYIYIIFFTSVVIYISRFVYQFIKLYRSLLEKILEIQEQNSIPIKHFDQVVSKHFPLSNELFYLFVKIMLSLLFFAIIYDTMQNVGYITFGAQPDLTTIISLIFLFGPPRLVEALLMTDFTSRVHMKEKEIKEELDRIKAKNDTEDKTFEKKFFTDEEKEHSKCAKCLLNCFRTLYPDDSKKLSINKPKVLKDHCEYKPRYFSLRWLCMFFCGCCSCPLDDKGYCKCCAILEESKSDNVEITWLKMQCVCIENEETKVQKRKKTEETFPKEPFETEDEDEDELNTEAKNKSDEKDRETTEANEGYEFDDINREFPSNENEDHLISSSEEEEDTRL